jgi:hypothetical protein
LWLVQVVLVSHMPAVVAQLHAVQEKVELHQD